MLGLSGRRLVLSSNEYSEKLALNRIESNGCGIWTFRGAYERWRLADLHAIYQRKGGCSQFLSRGKTRFGCTRREAAECTRNTSRPEPPSALFCGTNASRNVAAGHATPRAFRRCIKTPETRLRFVY
eukprot:6200168-Pleurochrysis_carterae.AAC.2